MEPSQDQARLLIRSTNITGYGDFVDIEISVDGALTRLRMNREVFAAALFGDQVIVEVTRKGLKEGAKLND